MNSGKNIFNQTLKNKNCHIKQLQQLAEKKNSIIRVRNEQR
jgi:hypothetical protein